MGVATGVEAGVAVGQARTGPDPRLGPAAPGRPPARRGRPRPRGAAAPRRRADPLTPDRPGRPPLRTALAAHPATAAGSALPAAARRTGGPLPGRPGAPATGRRAGPGPRSRCLYPRAAATATAARHWRQELKPGLTGLAQVRSRSGMPWDEPALLDQHYAEHHWVGLDLAILARAVHTPLRRAIRGLTRHGKAHLSDTDHRRCGYSAAE
ncbi:sugar transferase [Streptomyces atratus]|uniref:sugar transferase n=1 Tax=Streptomyces atratus TaxID=1893 RepID=UPI0036D40F02